MAEALAGFAAFAALPTPKLQLLADRIVIRLYNRDGVIHDETRSKHRVYLVLAGVARLTCLNFKGERVLLEVVGPADVVAIPPLLPAARADLRLRASTDCRVGLLSPETLIQDVLDMGFGDFSHALGVTCGRWWQLLMRHSLFMEQSLAERVVLALLDLASKIGISNPHDGTFTIELTHQDLAHLVIGSRAKVSASLAQLAAQDAIVQEGRTRIVVMPERLHQIAGF